MNGAEALQGLRDALIEVLADTNGDPVPPNGYANSRQLMNRLVEAAIASTDPTPMIAQMITLLNIPDAPPQA